MEEKKTVIEEKHWSPKLEEGIINSWSKSGVYAFNADRKGGKVFSIDTPPPYINAPVHMGHAYTYTWMDAIARHKRMQGFNVLFPIGSDRNGLPIEVQAEKEFKMSILKTPREEYIKNCRLLLDKYESSSLATFNRIGIGFNSWDVGSSIGSAYETDSEDYRRMTQETFIMLYRKGLVYENSMPSNYCTECHTTLSDSEVEYKEVQAPLYHLRFKTETGDGITVATTRPELLAACKVVLFNPEDGRYKKYEGMKAKVPVFGNEVKIIGNTYADPNYGSGVVMVCSYGDLDDIRILRELRIEPTYVIDELGRMRIEDSEYSGMKAAAAREEIVKRMKEEGDLLKVETVSHRYPICWRTKNPIEFIASKELYLKQVEFKEDLLKLSKGMRFFSEKSRKLLENWINGITIDWVISRRRYYGTEIPLWYCRSCGEALVPEPGRYYRPWKEKAPAERCEKCGGSEFRGEERVFDTWFDSASSQQYALGYLWDRKYFEENYPVTLRPQGKEIVRSWLYFTLLKSYLLFGKAPFADVWVNMYIVDEKGEKMSKSLGNVIDPMKIIQDFGSEAFRVWVFSEGITEDDVRCSNERIRASGKFLTKLWNIARFISSLEKPQVEGVTEDTDKVLLSLLAETSEKARKYNDDYMFEKSFALIRNFSWNVFADHYIELVKNRAYGEGFSKEESASARYTLYHTLKTILLLLAPTLPVITEHLWQRIYGEGSIHALRYPENLSNFGESSAMDEIIAFDSIVWNKKKELGKNFKDEIGLEIPERLRRFGKDLIALHNIQHVN